MVGPNSYTVTHANNALFPLIICCFHPIPTFPRFNLQPIVSSNLIHRTLLVTLFLPPVDSLYLITLVNRMLPSHPYLSFPHNPSVNRFEIAAGAHRADVTNVDMIKFMMENPDSSNVAKMRLDEWNHFLMCTTPELKTANKYRVEKSSIEKSIMDDVTLGTNTVVADHIKAAASPASRSDKDEFSNKVKKENMIGPDGYHFDLQKQSDGSYALSLFDACRHIQQYAHQEAGKELNSRLNWMSMCVVFLVTLIPFFTCINGTYKITSNITIVFLAFTTFDCMFFLRTIFTRFMMGAIIDYRRQFIMQRAFNDLLRTRLVSSYLLQCCSILSHLLDIPYHSVHQK